MQALVYRVTKHTIPGWIPFHEKEPRGIAYETDTHFVHVFGKDRGLWVISTGLTATQPKSGSLLDWIDRKRFDDPLKDLGLTPFGIARA